MQAVGASFVGIQRADLEAVHRATDLEWRLAQIPDEAMCRGAFFNMLDSRAGTLSAAAQLEYRRFFRLHQFSTFRMYPLGDYVTRLVVLSQIQFGVARVYDGLRVLQSGAFDAWAETLLGRAALALVDPSLANVLTMLERAYASRTVVTHGQFRVLSSGREEIITEFKNEHAYIEHAMVGAIEGVARVCGVRASVTAELDGPFDGRVRIRVEPPSPRRS